MFIEFDGAFYSSFHVYTCIWYNFELKVYEQCQNEKKNAIVWEPLPFAIYAINIYGYESSCHLFWILYTK